MTRLALVALAACTTTPADTSTPPFVPDAPTQECVATPYAWAPMETMGDIVAWEPAPDLTFTAGALNLALQAAGAASFTPVANGVYSWRVRYITQDRGAPIEATAVVVLPAVDAPSDAPSVLWAHGTTGYSDVCAPSRLGVEDMAPALLIGAQGWAVVAPDYIGMNGFGAPSEHLHPYLVPEPAAVASLDSLRALWKFTAQNSLDTPVTPTRTTVLWGGSEGGFTALWADRYASTYLPEAELVATVALVPPTDLRELATYATSGFHDATGGLAAGLVAMHDWYGPDVPLTDALVPYVADNLPGVMEACDDQGKFDSIATVDDIYQPAFSSAVSEGRWSDAEPWSCFLQNGVLRESPVVRGHDVPVLFVVSELDELVAAEVERRDAGRLCDAGYNLEYLECAGAGHSQGAVDSLPFQRDWVVARLAGEPLATDQDCVIDAAVTCER